MSRKKSLAVAVAVGAMGLLCGSAQAAPLTFYDGFDTLSSSWVSTPVTGGTFNTGGWAVTSTGSLAYTKGGTLQTSGNAINADTWATENQSGSATINIKLAERTAPLGTSGVTWVSGLVNFPLSGTGAGASIHLTRDNDNNGFATVSNWTEIVASIGVRAEANKFADISYRFNTGSRVDVLNPNNVLIGGNKVVATDPLPLQPSLFVIKLDANAKTMQFWFNPTIGGADPTGADWTATYTTADGNTAFDAIRISRDNATLIKNAFVDEIRVGTTFADVTPVPEPVGLSLLALGSLAMLRRRRQSAAGR